MTKKIQTAHLQKGMYVILPRKWLAHPFLKNEFCIESNIQIEKILKAGIAEVAVDMEKSDYKDNLNSQTIVEPEEKEIVPPVVPPDLREVIHDKKIPANKKAQLIHKHSIVMMNRLMDNPTVENIVEAKKGIADIVDLILANDSTNQHLLNITSHDYNTYIHSVNVGVLAISAAKKIFARSSAHDMHELGAAFFLHDLGKVNVDINIITKPSVLTDEEMLDMRKHPQYGHEILAQTRQLTDECRIIVLHHHERNDGNGYPLQLKGDDIHVYGRICSLADVYDALSSARPYRPGLGSFAALKLMKEEMLSHFHKDLFEKFVLMFTK
jgi:HD-GYP domain-containing protein (c-di-GMP phosphodiesterase class II)